MANHEHKKGLVVELIAAGKTKAEIADESGIPFGSMSYYLAKWNLKVVRSRGRYDKHREWIEEMVNAGESYADISNLIEISISTLNYLCSKWGIKAKKKSGRYDHLKDKAEELLRQDMSITKVAERLSIPSGSMAYLIACWGLGHLQLRAKGIHFSDSGRESVIEAAKERHAKSGYMNEEGRGVHGLLKFHDEFFPEEDVRVILEELREQDLTIAKMAEECGVTPKTITNQLRKLGLQGGHRKGDRAPNWKGGHTKYRGPGWLTIRQEILERDEYKCTECGLTQEEARAKGHGLSVHHIIPFERTQDNSHENLISLCQRHHMIAEWKSGTRVDNMPHLSV